MKQKMFKLMPVSLMAMATPLVTMADWGAGEGDAGGQGLPAGTIHDIVFNLASWLLLLLGSIALIGFVISGILYLTAAGNEEKMETAKKGMIYSVIGVIVGLLGYVIVQAVDAWLGGTSEDF
ncbi:MAG: pilin [Patescibacteria group bacterium]|nr:pilin [Patescibacteria group bacterium]